MWFDPQLGFVTDDNNLKGSWIDRAFPVLMGAAFGAMGVGVVGGVLANAGGVVQAAASGAVGSALNQFVSTGRVNMRSVLQAALTGGASAGLVQATGLGALAQSGQLGDRLLHHAGRASLQGLMTQASGGRFGEGFMNGAMAAVASEVTLQLDAQIAQMRGLSAYERSTMRLLSRAAGTALRVAGSSDPAAGFASDFLSGVMGDAVQAQVATSGTPGAPSTDQAPTDAGAHQGARAAQARAITVAAGDTLEGLARQLYGANWRAGLPMLMADNQLATNRWGSPIIRPGQQLLARHLQDFSPSQLAQLHHLGGQIIGRNSQGLNLRAQIAAMRAAQAAAQQAARQNHGMGQDEAYALYMASGGRSGSYQRALGEDYRTTWHGGQAIGAQTQSSSAASDTANAIERYLGAAQRGVNAAVNAVAEPFAVAADLAIATTGAAYTSITGKPVDMPFISFMSQDVANGATTTELLQGLNPA